MSLNFRMAVLLGALLPSFIVSAASVDKAQLLQDHGLQQEAKKELVDVIFGGASADDKARAYYLLGSIAFDERRISAALDTWTKLVEKYPTSRQASLVKDNISELAEIAGDATGEAVNNAIAQSYLSHADFWSSDKDRIFKIDSSWIAKVDAAVAWYDRVIYEFPNTPAAQVAFVGKMRALLGWESGGRYPSRFGVKEDFSKYMPQLLETFGAYEHSFPSAGSLQAFRYQIAQAYWEQKDWGKTREWLNLIVTKAGDDEGFYKDLAKRRLMKVEY